MGMFGPEDSLCTPLLHFARVPFQAGKSVHKTPFWENVEVVVFSASIFAQILALSSRIKIFSVCREVVGLFFHFFFFFFFCQGVLEICLNVHNLQRCVVNKGWVC